MRYLSLFLFCLISGMSSVAETVSVGLTQRGTSLEVQIVRAADAQAPTVLLIGGFGNDKSPEVIRKEIEAWEKIHPAKRKFRVLGIPHANPDETKVSFPPDGDAYRESSEAHYLWRWLGSQAPDLVVIVGNDPSGLEAALSTHAVAGYGKIPVRKISARRGILKGLKTVERSNAAREKARRSERTPLQLIGSLENFYGRDLNSVVYVPTMAVAARLRIGKLDDVERIVRPYMNGEKDSLRNATSSHLPGHLVFAELAEKTNKPEYVALVKRAADVGFNADGSLKESMPFHDEMSDSVFMGCPILVKAGKLTGEKKYFDMALKHFRFMQSLDKRNDGLYRHSPLHETAWGRGNAFPALGLALSLLDLPQDHPAYPEMLSAYQDLMKTLIRYQDRETGMWRQVVDHPSVFPEFTSTAMIGRSLLIGIRKGWLDAATYQPHVDAAWKAILQRTSDDGQFVDVCESTAKQKSLEDYLYRKAILGKDQRAGAMAMMFAIEMAGL